MALKQTRSFDARAFLESAGFAKRVVVYARGDVIFPQVDPCDSVMYIRSGAVQLSVLSHAGREAIVGWVLPKISQGALAEMVGTTRSRVNFFMNRFKKRDFVEYDGSLKI